MTITRKRLQTSGAVVGVLILTLGLVTSGLASPPPGTKQKKAGFVGVDGCKTCHRSEYRAWKNGPHSGALDTLPEKDRKNPACLTCHTTGNAEKPAPGVQCEACHGPGSRYRSPSIMKDPRKARAAGLKTPGVATCKGCHNPESPTFKGFSYDEYLRQLPHVREALSRNQ